MRVLIIGVGGIGGYFGGRLALNDDVKVSLALHSNFDLIKHNGIYVKSIKGDFEFKIDQIFHDDIPYDGEEFDCIILATKTLSNINQIALLKNFIKSDKTSIMIIQNGIDTELEIMKAFPNNEIASTVAYIGVCKENGNIINHTGGEGVLQIGVLNRKAPSETLKSISTSFLASNVNASIIDNIRQKRYEKLMWNIPFNSISVIGGGLLTHEMTNHPDIEILCRNIMLEIIEIAKSENIIIPVQTISDKIEYTREFPTYATSMLLDFKNYRKLEVDAIVGNILKIAKKNHINAPHIETIYALLKVINDKI